MTEPERAEAVANLEASQRLFEAAVTGISEAQASFKPSPERWNVKEIVEHVAIAEHGMYRLITAYAEPSDSPHNEESADALARLSDRKARPFQAPERVLPKGRFGSLAEALAKFLENRERTIEFIKTCQDNLHFRIINHPAGRMNCSACLWVLTNHPVRHADQIGELKADPGYPKDPSA